MNLRSPAAISAVPPSLRVFVQNFCDLRLGRRGVELEVALEGVVDYGPRRAAPMTAVLDDAGGGDRRMILRRERDEPGVVLELLGRLVLGLVLARRSLVADDLRRAGFAAYDDVVEVRLMRGAARAVDDVGHSILHVFERVGIDLHPVLDHRRISLGYVAVQSFDVLHELRLVADAAVGDLRRDLRTLKRSRGDVALADGDRKRFRRIPSLVIPLLLPRRRRDGAGIFVIEIDAGLDAESHQVGPLGNSIDAELDADVVKVDVA